MVGKYLGWAQVGEVGGVGALPFLLWSEPADTMVVTQFDNALNCAFN